MLRSSTSLYIHLGRFWREARYFTAVFRSSLEAFTPGQRSPAKLKSLETPIVMTIGVACNYSFMDAAFSAKLLWFGFVTLLECVPKTLVACDYHCNYNGSLMQLEFMDAAFAAASPLKSARSGLDKL